MNLEYNLLKNLFYAFSPAASFSLRLQTQLQGDLPNTIIKISSLGAIYDKPDPKLKTYVNQMITAYGLEQMIYGGGFDENATPESYRATIEYTRSFIAKFSETDQANVLGGNASRLLCRAW